MEWRRRDWISQMATKLTTDLQFGHTLKANFLLNNVILDESSRYILLLFSSEFSLRG